MVSSIVRISSVAADTADCDVHRIDVGVGVTFSHTNTPNLKLRAIVKSDGKIRLPESSVKAIVQECAGATGCFLCRLTYKNDGAAPLILQFVERTHHPNEGGHVDVVAARVHDRDVLAIGILCHNRAGIGKTSLLLYR